MVYHFLWWAPITKINNLTSLTNNLTSSTNGITFRNPWVVTAFLAIIPHPESFFVPEFPLLLPFIMDYFFHFFSLITSFTVLASIIRTSIMTTNTWLLLFWVFTTSKPFDFFYWFPYLLLSSIFSWVNHNNLLRILILTWSFLLEVCLLWFDGIQLVYNKIGIQLSYGSW